MKVVSVSEDQLPLCRRHCRKCRRGKRSWRPVVDRLDTTTTRYKMEIGPDKTQVMTNNPNGFQREIKIKGQRLEEVENFKYLGAIISNEGSKPEILSRIAQPTAALSRLKIMWRDKTVRLRLRLSWCGRSTYSPSLWELDLDTRNREKGSRQVLLQLHLWCSDDLRG